MNSAKEFKFYADNGDGDAMVRLAEYYGGTNGDEYEDYVKNFYWSLRALEAGEPHGAFEIALCYEYEKGVEENKDFAMAWHARYCIEADKKGWDTELYASYEELEKAGYTKNDWEFLAGPTYVHVPMYSTQQEDSIVDAALLAVDLLNQKAEDFAVELKVYKQNKSLAASSAQKTQGSFSTNLIPQAPQQAVAAQPKKKTNWLSAIGRALNVASSAGGGNNFISGLVQGLSSGSVATGARPMNFSAKSFHTGSSWRLSHPKRYGRSMPKSFVGCSNYINSDFFHIQASLCPDSA